MREIAKAAGVGKSTLYDYFKSKDEILISYFENEIQKITERAQEIIKENLGVSGRHRTRFAGRFLRGDAPDLWPSLGEPFG